MKKLVTCFLFLSITLAATANAFRPMSSSLQNVNTNAVPTMQKPTIAVDDEQNVIHEKVNIKEIKHNPFTKEKLIMKSVNFWLKMLESDNPLMRNKAEKALTRLSKKYGDLVLNKLIKILENGADEDTFESIKNIIINMFEMPENGDIFSSDVFQALWDLVHNSDADMTGRIQAANILLNLGIPDAVDFASDFLEGVIEGYYDVDNADLILAAKTLLEIGYCPDFVMEVLVNILNSDPSAEMAEAIKTLLINVFEFPENGDIFDSAIFQALWDLVHDSNADMTGRILAANILLNMNIIDCVDFASDFLEGVMEGNFDVSDSDLLLAATTLIDVGYGIEYVIEIMAETNNVALMEQFAEFLIDFFSNHDNYNAHYDKFINVTFNNILSAPDSAISIQIKALILYIHDAVNPDGGNYDGLEGILLGDWNGATMEDRAFVAKLFGQLGYFHALIDVMGNENAVFNDAIENALVMAYSLISPERQAMMVSALRDVALNSDNALARISAINVLKKLGVRIPRRSRHSLLRRHSGSF